jgi:hypothetical protein
VRLPLLASNGSLTVATDFVSIYRVENNVNKSDPWKIFKNAIAAMQVTAIARAKALFLMRYRPSISLLLLSFSSAAFFVRLKKFRHWDKVWSATLYRNWK